jgi:DNA-3-methyladenine glycosylase
MFGAPARLYVYFTYGMHWCANVVCGQVGECEAVLLRAGQPLEGIGLMSLRRGIDNEKLLAAGPARLAQAMGLGKAHDGASLLRGSLLWCAEDEDTRPYREGEVAQTARIGLAKGKGDEIPWRFVIPGNPYASRRR